MSAATLTARLAPETVIPSEDARDLAPYEGESCRAQAATAWEVFLRVSRQVWSLGLGRMVVASADEGHYVVDAQDALHRVLREARPGDPWVLRRATASEAERLAEAWARGDVRLSCATLRP